MSKNVKIVLVIVAILIICCVALVAGIYLLSIASISTLQTVGRDTVRKSDIINIEIAISTYYYENGYYPESIEVNGNVYTLDNNSMYKYALEGDYDSSEFVFCYENLITQYKLGVKLEDNTWFNRGLVNCADSDIKQ